MARWRTAVASTGVVLCVRDVTNSGTVLRKFRLGE